eukprot:scaffold879_cov410-Prasinococcus_capsulatus_cf.AAC.29
MEEEQSSEPSFVEDQLQLEAALCAAADAPSKSVQPFLVAARTLQRYQDHAHLLDHVLEQLVAPVVGTLQARLLERLLSRSCRGCHRLIFLELARQAVGPASEFSEEHWLSVTRICGLLHVFVQVRGYKAVSKCLPHETCDVEPALLLLTKLHNRARNNPSIGPSSGPATNGAPDDEFGADWSSRCTLLLWLSVLVLIPFDLETVDVASAEDTDDALSRLAVDVGEADRSPGIVRQLFDLCLQYLDDPGPTRLMSCVLLSRLLTRPDTRFALDVFMRWAMTFSSEKASAADHKDVLRIAGVLQSLAFTFRLGSRTIMQSFAQDVWERVISPLCSSQTRSIASSVVIRKLLAKLVPRVCMAFLPQKVVAWRYQRGHRSLSQNLSNCVVERDHMEPDAIGEDTEVEDTGGGMDVTCPELVEEVVETLLQLLGDKDTVVRWSAAKGLARVTARLPLEMADEVVASVLDTFSAVAQDQDASWHGGCLALAELAQRGLLLPARIPDTVPHVVRALLFDMRRGSHSVGAGVRDAAAYVCWAFARAYAPGDIAPHVETLAPTLMVATLFDREVNCRRAASAAFQEAVGRLGNLPNGIAILGIADYYSLGNRTATYTSLAPRVAKFEVYREPLINHLLDVKLRHWDQQLRELAADALAELVPLAKERMNHEVTPLLAGLSLSTDLPVRHGAVCGLSRVLRSLSATHDLGASTVQKLLELVPAFEKARLYRGKGGEMMRVAICSLIQSLVLCSFDLPVSLQGHLLESIDNSLKHPSKDVRGAAAEALKHFSRSCMIYQEAADNNMLEDVFGSCTRRYLDGLAQDDLNFRRGAAGALSVLPAVLLFPWRREVVTSLCTAATNRKSRRDQRAKECMPDPASDDDAESRAAAARSLAAVCCTLGLEGSYALTHEVTGAVVPALMDAMCDYSVDKRGDVGSWVREAAMESIGEVAALMCSSRQLSREVFATILKGLVKQSVEKINRIRETAGKVLAKLVHGLEGIPELPDLDILRQAVPIESSGFWSTPRQCFPAMVNLLRVKEFQSAVMQGLILSVGGISDSLGQTATDSLVDLLQTASSKDEVSSDTSRTLLEILRENPRQDRVVIPLLRTVDYLLVRGLYSSSSAEDHQFCSELVPLLQAETRKCRDIQKLRVITNISCHIVAMPRVEVVRCGAIGILLDMLVNRYPKVRSYAAEQFYVCLITEDTIDDPEPVLEVLQGTRWEDSVEEVGGCVICAQARATLSRPCLTAGDAGTEPTVSTVGTLASCTLPSSCTQIFGRSPKGSWLRSTRERDGVLSRE